MAAKPEESNHVHAVPKKSRVASREETQCRRRAEILDKAIQLFATDATPAPIPSCWPTSSKSAKARSIATLPTRRSCFLRPPTTFWPKCASGLMRRWRRLPIRWQRSARRSWPILSFFAENPDYVELLIQERALFKDRGTPTFFRYRERNVQRWRDLYRGLMADGRVRDMPPERITDVLSDLTYGTMCANYFAHRDRDPAEQVEAILDIFWRGILSDSERAKVSTAHSCGIHTVVKCATHAAKLEGNHATRERDLFYRSQAYVSIAAGALLVLTASLAGCLRPGQQQKAPPPPEVSVALPKPAKVINYEVLHGPHRSGQFGQR